MRERRQEVAVGLVAGPFTPPTRLSCTRCRLGRHRRSFSPRSTAQGSGRAVPVRWRRETQRKYTLPFQGKTRQLIYCCIKILKQNTATFKTLLWLFSLSFLAVLTPFCLIFHSKTTFALCCHNSKTFFFTPT